MSIKVQVADFLIQNGSLGYCDECLPVVLELPSHDEVQQVTRELSEERLFTKAAGRCGHCHKEKQVTWCRRISAYAC